MTAKPVYPTRGGEVSFPNQDRPTVIAKERKIFMPFLYISNVKFLGLTAAPKVIDFVSEPEEMGEFPLARAQERAINKDVQADILSRQGDFNKIKRAVIDQHNIETLVLGSSTGETGVISRDYMKQLAGEISSQYCVEFIMPPDGVILETIQIASDP